MERTRRFKRGDTVMVDLGYSHPQHFEVEQDFDSYILVATCKKFHPTKREWYEFRPDQILGVVYDSDPRGNR